MSLLDIFRAGKIKKENELLSAELEECKKMLTPEMQDSVRLQMLITDLNKTVENKNAEISRANETLVKIDTSIKEKRTQLLDIDEQILFEEFSLYKPKYDLTNSDEYKLKLDAIRQTQKDLIKNGKAVSGNMNWTVNNSAAQGKKMVSDMQKLLLRAFNSECDELIGRVTYSNIEQSEKRITAACENISKLGRIMQISISWDYQKAKLNELYLVFEYRQAKQREKEEQKELRAQMREEAKLRKEIEETRKKVEKEQKHYQNALKTVLSQLSTASDVERAVLEEKKKELEDQLGEIAKNIQDIDYREANAKAGYVYIISNIGAFGENIYKIGMTRRLDPTERVDELGDAVVPFDFDIHAMIFSDDAPALEAALHKAFENKKLNMVNHRREFFAVTLDEIKEVVRKNYNNSVEFIELAPAQQYRESMKLKEQKKQ
jgi:hypothetical protein